jgi:XTP/dITP diphosphohydrolase
MDINPTTLNRIVLASGNRGKLRELNALLAPLGIDVVAQSELGIDSPPETGETFLDNALLKARYASNAAKLPALADDSGIEVDALDGRPGVYSARYAGENASDLENLRKMLIELQGVELERRTARYQCVIAFVRSADDAEPLIARGTWEGRVLTVPRGTQGFGYDPIFLPSGFDQTAAELAPDQKNQISHRGQALRALIEQLQCR